MTQIPSIGRIVHYSLTAQDVMLITTQRQGVLTQGSPRGNRVREGDVFPMIITRVWGTKFNSAVNGQVLLDGNDVHWASSATVGEGPGHFVWPARPAALAPPDLGEERVRAAHPAA